MNKDHNLNKINPDIKEFLDELAELLADSLIDSYRSECKNNDEDSIGNSIE